MRWSKSITQELKIPHLASFASRVIMMAHLEYFMLKGIKIDQTSGEQFNLSGTSYAV